MEVGNFGNKVLLKLGIDEIDHFNFGNWEFWKLGLWKLGIAQIGLF